MPTRAAICRLEDLGRPFASGAARLAMVERDHIFTA